MNYQTFLDSKTQLAGGSGFEPLWMPEFLYDFQGHLVDWSIRKGCSALLEDCGLGKTPQQLVIAENWHRKTNKPVMIFAPLAVSQQTVREGEKFGIEVKRTKNGEVHPGINITNYQRIEKYDPSKFVGCIADESSCLKGEDRAVRRAVTSFMSKVKYRLLCTATPAPNDYMELGGSSEALGNMTRNQMLSMFFVNDGETTQQWRIKGHSHSSFWQWVASWARAVRMPSDLGFDNRKFTLPPLNVAMHEVNGKGRPGFLFYVAKTLKDQRDERRSSLVERCEKAASVLPLDKPVLAWVQLNNEGDLLTKTIPGAVQVSGSDDDEDKEEKLGAFSSGQIRALVTKPSIAGHGLNWQHCADVSYFPSWSHEQYYQAIRRCWRFGQHNPVNVHLVSTDSESSVVSGMLHKERMSIDMYDGICREMGKVIKLSNGNGKATESERIPSWLSNSK